MHGLGSNAQYWSETDVLKVVALQNVYQTVHHSLGRHT